ncbi:MAG TPA: helix-turn-helix domain-containing protein [Devosia sp.]|jgi:DNA-binding transcriptional MerR regulator|nr:helix-turn-helix domain-containing protein [Devosia sp.]
MRVADYSIGELSAETGVKIPTIRYYEGVGLIDPPPRSAGNQRRYGEAARERLRFIAHARSMGFPMGSLRAMLRIAGHRDAPCADLDALVRGRLAEVDERIARLTALRAELSSMLADSRHGTVGECRVVEVLSDHAECTHPH